MAEDIGERTGLRDRATKGVVGVGGDDVARRVGVAEDVAVGVGVRDVDHAVALDVEETAHAARALLRAGEVVTPEVFAGTLLAVGEGDSLENNVHVVPDEGVRLMRLPAGVVVAPDYLADTAVPVVIAIDVRADHRPEVIGATDGRPQTQSAARSVQQSVTTRYHL